MKRLSPEEQVEVLRRIPQLSQKLEDRLGITVPLGGPHTELWPLLGAARCLRLLKGMLALSDADMTDVLGVLARAHYETWAAAMYACHGGQAAVDELAADFMHYFGDLAHTLRVELPNNTPEVLARAAPKGLSTKALARRLENRLPNVHPLKQYPLAAYEHLFAGESLFSSHGRVGSFLRHQQGAGNAIAIRVSDLSSAAHLDRIWEAGTLTACLAIDALAAHGQAVADLKDLVESIGLPAYPDR